MCVAGGGKGMMFFFNNQAQKKEKKIYTQVQQQHLLHPGVCVSPLTCLFFSVGWDDDDDYLQYMIHMCVCVFSSFYFSFYGRPGLPSMLLSSMACALVVFLSSLSSFPVHHCIHVHIHTCIYIQKPTCIVLPFHFLYFTPSSFLPLPTTSFFSWIFRPGQC